MRILVATFSFPDPSMGAYDAKFVFAEAQAYAANGAEVVVLTPHYPGADMTERIAHRLVVRRFRYFLPTSLQALRVPGRPLYRPKSLLALAQAPFLLASFCVALIRHGRHADVIHAQWTLTALLALPSKWLFGTSVVVTARGSDLRLLPAWLNRWIHRKVDAAIDCFGPQPWNVAYKAANPTRYLRLPLLVESGPSDGSAPGLDGVVRGADRPLVVLYVGRFDRIKINSNRLPVFELIEAAARLRRHPDGARLFFLGHGEPELLSQMEDAILRFNVSDRVAILGPTLNVAAYVAKCDLGVGGIALNGVSQDFTIAGKPQLLMDTEENQNTPWVTHINSLVVPPADVSALVSALEWAMDDRLRLSNLGRRAKSDLAPFLTDAEDGGALYISAFRSLLGLRCDRP